MKTNKSKVISIGVILVIALVISYILAFKKTINLYESFSDLKISNAQVQALKHKKLQLNQKKKAYQTYLNSSEIYTGSLQNRLLEKINTISRQEDLIVKDFNPPHHFKEKDITIHTFEFKVIGRYTGISRLLYLLEAKHKFGQIISVSYEKKYDLKSKKPKLEARIILQSLG